MTPLYDAIKDIWTMNGVTSSAELLGKNVAEGTFTISVEISEDDISLIEAMKRDEDIVSVRLPDGVKEGKIVEIGDVPTNPFLTKIRLRIPRERILHAR